ncbi:DUF2723 domain-containing protein [Pseudobacter ginsenosidimutans]|uniref:Uncharacterized protein DUF2723 n=1 Tax=Pseudobacter ginsenosidimutans TaxID=661488 RepID=A0A4Q7MT15_9BACT|nr:DUF2723 domain-containing protein [Pseudobacter ginsenosidimutans]QEC41471.1 DUF2723 domain-containing protein [Pseudobacter ginsenosidimutans]RZS71747.1 uncharacterized protein DUF2723 [Pseudobacter ginsenosidimutans]
MQFNKLNNLFGWLVCAVACTTYLITLEPTTSFWDCGEFISSANKLQIPHPPGSPLFILMGRFFVVLFGDNPQTAAIAVNSMSAIASGFTILFLFWTITYFARKLVLPASQATPTGQQTFTILSAGVIGSLAYAFSDSFWFSAVEGEVYALSSFFTALVFWAIFKWEARANEPRADRWLVFIFFMMGLSIGVHLLNLLTIPAVLMVYYFKKYKFTRRGAFIALITGCAITVFIMKFIVQSTIRGAGQFDIFFTNEFGLPFFTGFIIFFALIGAGLLLAIRYASRRNWYRAKLALWCALFVMLGYSTYTTTLIRSNADPAVNMFSVDNPISLASYLGRESYNDWPLFYGPDFTERAPFKKAGEEYVKGEKKYETAGPKYVQDWANAPGAHFFPRIWDNNDDRNQKACYYNFTGLEEGETPTMKDNIAYFSRYQAGWMYMRYFMWNFAGRQNDLQGYGNPRDSNFISGINFVDNSLYGNQSKMPDTARESNKAYNRLFMLPLALGLVGLFFQLRRNNKDWFVNTLLFLITGIGIVIFLNQSGHQPRERDYAFVGSFYAFAVWIGLGVVGLISFTQKHIKKPAAAWATAALCFFAVPVLMAQQEWDDHDRSGKTLARDLARNYLESCPPNAILITAEDNDTYPIWYLQEVEGVRRDVRVVIATMIGNDWCIDQLRYKVNNSAPVDVLFTKEQVAGNKRGVVYFNKMQGFDPEKHYDLYESLKNTVASDDSKYTTVTEDGETYHLLPMNKFSIPVDQAKAIASGAAHNGEKIADQLLLDFSGKNYLFKHELAPLAIIAANKWERPICFASSQTASDYGLGNYVRSKGLVYQLSPVQNSEVDNETAYANVMNHFQYGNTHKSGMYLDETNRLRLNVIKMAHVQLAMSLVKAGEMEKAKKVLRRFDENVSPANMPYGFTSNRGNQHNIMSLQFLHACYLAGDLELAKKVTASLRKDLLQQMEYYRSLGEEPQSDDELARNAYQLIQGGGASLNNHQVSFANDILSSFQLLNQVSEWEKQPAAL